VPEDRFADLGPGGPDKRSAAERFAELDERDPEEQPQPPEPPRPSGRYAWVVGIAFVAVLVIAGINSLPNQGAGYRGIPAGDRLTPFAAPLATSDHDDKDVNFQRRSVGDVPAACDVRLPGVVNLCDLRRKPLVFTFVATGGSPCGDQLDRVERLRREFPQVTFVGVLSRRELDDAKEMVRENGWGFPVVLDRDAQLFNQYGVGDCPTTIFARRGGVSAGSINGRLTEPRLRRHLKTLLAGRRVS
jgi:hypothetical protein